MLNLNFNTIDSIREKRGGPIRYSFPATIYLLGGGGGGESGTGITGRGGGGGGASAFVSASILIAPNVTYNIQIGNKGTGSLGGFTPTKGGDSFIYGYTDDYNTPVTMSAQGGYPGSGGAGGNSGSGSIEYTTTTINFPSFNGGALVNASAGGYFYQATGGGAGSSQNGQNGLILPPSEAGDGGSGGGIPNYSTHAGGGGGGADSTPSSFRGVGKDGGGNGGTDLEPGTAASSYGSGGGGSGANGEGGGNGAEGTAFIIYDFNTGEEYSDGKDVSVTNGTIIENGSGKTVIRFNVGNGTFRFTAPYPYVPKP